MDPNSEQPVELGTLEFPFKDLTTVVVDIMNLHSHSDVEINIFMAEYSYHYLEHDTAKIVNITKVNFDSYSPSLNDEVNRATLVLSSIEFDLMATQTIFSLIQDTTIQDIDISNMEQTEIDEVTSSSDFGIMINRADVSFNNLDVMTQETENVVYVTSFYTVWNFGRLVKFTNMHFAVHGTIYQNHIASANVYGENLTMDLSNADGGFVYYSS